MLQGRLAPIGMRVALSLLVMLLVPYFLTDRSASGHSLPPSGPVLSDDFNDGALDLSLWQHSIIGSGPTAREANGRLEIVLPGNSTDDAAFGPIVGAPHGGFWAGYISGYRLRGDFDVAVDYSLLQWPASNGVRVALALIPVGSRLTSVQRSSFGNPANDFPNYPRDVYATHFADNPALLATSHVTGSLRLTRVGATTSGYYGQAGEWTLIHAGPNTLANVQVALLAWGHHPAFMNQTVKVAFDNFQIIGGQVVRGEAFLPIVLQDTD